MFCCRILSSGLCLLVCLLVGWFGCVFMLVWSLTPPLYWMCYNMSCCRYEMEIQELSTKANNLASTVETADWDLKLKADVEEEERMAVSVA